MASSTPHLFKHVTNTFCTSKTFYFKTVTREDISFAILTLARLQISPDRQTSHDPVSTSITVSMQLQTALCSIALEFTSRGRQDVILPPRVRPNTEPAHKCTAAQRQTMSSSLKFERGTARSRADDINCCTATVDVPLIAVLSPALMCDCAP